MFDTVKNSLGSNWPQRTPTLNIEWGQIDPKVTGGLKVTGGPKGSRPCRPWTDASESPWDNIELKIENYRRQVLSLQERKSQSWEMQKESQREEFAWELNEGRYARLPVMSRRLIAPTRCHAITPFWQILHHIPDFPPFGTESMEMRVQNHLADHLGLRSDLRGGLHVRDTGLEIYPPPPLPLPRGQIQRKAELIPGGSRWPEGMSPSPGSPWVGKDWLES